MLRAGRFPQCRHPHMGASLYLICDSDPGPRRCPTNYPVAPSSLETQPHRAGDVCPSWWSLRPLVPRPLRLSPGKRSSTCSGCVSGQPHTPALCLFSGSHRLLSWVPIFCYDKTTLLFSQHKEQKSNALQAQPGAGARTSVSLGAGPGCYLSEALSKTPNVSEHGRGRLATCPSHSMALSRGAWCKRKPLCVVCSLKDRSLPKASKSSARCKKKMRPA